MHTSGLRLDLDHGTPTQQHFQRAVATLLHSDKSSLKRKIMEKETTPQTREEILAASLDARIQEVMHYQINIDNYAIALEEIGNLPPDERAELSAFTSQLRDLLTSEKLEQKKAQIMLNVIKRQVG
jgi:hypothetical protein